MKDRLWGPLARAVRQNWLVLLIVGSMAVAFLALRTPATAVDTVSEVDAILAGGQPTLVEFYANV